MARFEFTVPTLADPDLRVRLDTAADNSGTSVTDVLIGDRAADSAQGFDLRGVVTFLGPDGVDTLYLKALNYRGKVIGASIALAGVVSGGGSVPSTVVHSFDVAADASGINTALVAGVNTGIVIPAGSLLMPYGLTLSVSSAWDGTGPFLAIGASQADLISQTNALEQDLTVTDTPWGLGSAGIFPSGGSGSSFSSNLSVYVPDDMPLWVCLLNVNIGPGTDPGSTTGSATLLVAYPPAA